jgi:hypothetical protein
MVLYAQQKPTEMLKRIVHKYYLDRHSKIRTNEPNINLSETSYPTENQVCHVEKNG